MKAAGRAVDSGGGRVSATCSRTNLRCAAMTADGATVVGHGAACPANGDAVDSAGAGVIAIGDAAVSTCAASGADRNAADPQCSCVITGSDAVGTHGVRERTAGRPTQTDCLTVIAAGGAKVPLQSYVHPWPCLRLRHNCRHRWR